MSVLRNTLKHKSFSIEDSHISGVLVSYIYVLLIKHVLDFRCSLLIVIVGTSCYCVRFYHIVTLQDDCLIASLLLFNTHKASTLLMYLSSVFVYFMSRHTRNIHLSLLHLCLRVKF